MARINRQTIRFYFQGWGRREFEDKTKMMNLTPEQNVERQEKWEPIHGIETPAASASISEDHEGLSVVLFFSEIVDGYDADLWIKFGRVLAYTIYEEMVYPWEISEAAPRLTGRWETYIYPMLQIKDSKWMASLPDLLVVYPDAMHYRLLTLDKIVDVLCSKLPEVLWVSGRK